MHDKRFRWSAPIAYSYSRSTKFDRLDLMYDKRFHCSAPIAADTVVRLGLTVNRGL